MNKFADIYADEKMQQLWNTDAIVFDMRGNDRGVYSLMKYFFEEPVVLARYLIPDITYPGTFFWDESSTDSFNDNVYNGKIIILTDARTTDQDACMALQQHPDAITLGTTTCGSGGFQSQIFLPGQLLTSFTTWGLFYPDFTPTQGVGIIPDITVSPTIDGIRQGRDEILEAAFDCTLVGNNENQTGMEKAEILIFPNPFSDEITLSYESDQHSDIMVHVYDLTGKTEYRSVINDVKAGRNYSTLNMENLNPGVYFCRIQTKNDVHTTKIIKQ